MLALLALLAVSQAADTTVAVVGLHVAGIDEAAQTEAIERLSKVTRKAGLEPLDPAVLAETLRGREEVVLEEAFLGPGRKLLADGRTLYQQAQFDAAVPVLQEAIEQLSLGVATAGSVRELWEAWVVLGSTHLLRDDRDAARDALGAAATLNPKRQPNAAEYPPDVVSLYETVRGEKQATASKLQVKVDVADVAVFLNGESIGLAPLTARDVLPGTNHLLGRGAGGSVAYALVEMPASGELSVMLDLATPTLGAAAADSYARSRQTTTLYRALGEHSKTDLVLLAGSNDDSLLLQLYAPRADAFSVPVELALGPNPAASAADALPELFAKVREDGTFFSSQIATGAVPLDVGANTQLARMLLDPQPLSAPQPRKKRASWAVVGIIGAGAAVTAAGLAIALTAETAPRYQGRIVVEVE